jgi:steroid 5-alpha reductase family enzyme
VSWGPLLVNLAVTAGLVAVLMRLRGGRDAQLRRFRADPANAGRVLDRGLWRYTRHPNYFGDAVVWFGLWLLACSHWLGLVLVACPLYMTNMLVRHTGKRLLEKHMARSKGAAYADYVRRTSGFIPWPPQ